MARVRLVRPLQRQLLDRDQYARSSFEEVPAEAYAAVLGGRASLHLAGGLQVKRVRVTGEHRIELIGVSESARAALKTIGLFSEVISFRTRLFIPVGESGAAILATVLERYALLRRVSATTHA